MEELIPIIGAVIGAVIARIIKSKMNDATQTPSAPIPNPQSPRPRSLEDVLSEFETELEEEHEVYVETPQRFQPVVEEQKPAYLYEAASSIEKKSVAPESIEVEVKATEKKEKIDPKKLLVYSEIMNRKY